ncbi:MAG: hypothetical protein WCJ75_06060 [Desulfomonile sp.]|jgi:hypothetical protein
MVKRVVSLILFITMLASVSLALAGGAAAPVAYPSAPCAPRPYAAAGNPCAYWGDAPFPGMCGGVVALPFLVVGSLLGGNTVGPYGPVPGPNYGGPVPGPNYGGPVPGPNYGPRLNVPQAYGAPIARPVCGPAAAGPFVGNSIFSGLPCLDLCAGIFGSFTGGVGLGM